MQQPPGTVWTPPRTPDLVLGHGHVLTYYDWAPDRSIEANAERYAGLEDIVRAGCTVYHPRPDDGRGCAAAVTFDKGAARELWPESALWQVLVEEPLTIQPSILCRLCGDHGFIQRGQWVPV